MLRNLQILLSSCAIVDIAEGRGQNDWQNETEKYRNINLIFKFISFVIADIHGVGIRYVHSFAYLFFLAPIFKVQPFS